MSVVETMDVSDVIKILNDYLISYDNALSIPDSIQIDSDGETFRKTEHIFGFRNKSLILSAVLKHRISFVDGTDTSELGSSVDLAALVNEIDDPIVREDCLNELSDTSCDKTKVEKAILESQLNAIGESISVLGMPNFDENGYYFLKEISDRFDKIMKLDCNGIDSIYYKDLLQAAIYLNKFSQQSVSALNKKRKRKKQDLLEKIDFKERYIAIRKKYIEELRNEFAADWNQWLKESEGKTELDDFFRDTLYQKYDMSTVLYMLIKESPDVFEKSLADKILRHDLVKNGDGGNLYPSIAKHLEEKNSVFNRDAGYIYLSRVWEEQDSNYLAYELVDSDNKNPILAYIPDLSRTSDYGKTDNFHLFEKARVSFNDQIYLSFGKQSHIYVNGVNVNSLDVASQCIKNAIVNGKVDKKLVQFQQSSSQKATIRR